MGEYIKFSSNTKKIFYEGLKPSQKPSKIPFPVGECDSSENILESMV